MKTAPLICIIALFGCGPALETDTSSDDARLRRCHVDSDCRHGQTCQSGVCRTAPPGACRTSDDCANGGLCNAGACTASACNARASGKSGIRATVQVTRYDGTRTTTNGTHEFAMGTLQRISWMYEPSVRDTNTVQLALHIAETAEPSGLPHEIRLTPGEAFELEGEYIDAAAASAAGAAVIHFAHGPCGFVDLNGQQYR